jgi:uncharacterized protein (TIGR03089 family)
MSLTDALLAPRLSRDPAAPLVTHYDDATGERVEFSGVTLANWAAKTANLLRDECDLEPGGTVAVLLPAHWQALAVLLGAWWCGAEVVADPAGAQVVCCDADRLGPGTGAGAEVVVALSLDAFGKGLPGLPAGVVDYATEVRLHGDAFTPYSPVPGFAPALLGEPVDAVRTAALAAAADAGLGPADRVLTTREWSVADGLVEVPLAVLAAGAGLVQCRHADPAGLERRAATERVTRRLG